MNLITFGHAKSKTGLSSATSDQMEAGFDFSGSLGFDRFRLYRIYHFVRQKSDPEFFWSGKRGICQYSTLPASSSSTLPDFLADLWVYFWSIQLLLGKGKTDFPTHRITFSEEKLTCDLPVTIFDFQGGVKPPSSCKVQSV